MLSAETYPHIVALFPWAELLFALLCLLTIDLECWMGMKDTAGSANDVHVEEGGVGGTDDAANIEVQEGDFGSMPPPPHPSMDGDDTPKSIPQSSPTHGNKQHSMLRSRSIMRASRPTVKECLHTPDEEMYDLTLDVYNMFFLSDIGSQAFFYTFAVLFTKMSLYVLLLTDLKHNKKFPFEENVDAADVIKMAQFFLIPVMIVTQEELITSFFIFSHLKYSSEIKRRHPGAKKWKYVVAHCFRLLDGLLFLLINTCVMLLQKNDVLGLFLNFAALMFLQTIDNIALQVCLDGYWTRSLMESAQDVVDMKFAVRHHYTHNCMQTFFVVLVWSGLVAIWGCVHWNPNNNGRLTM